ncbi:hypothetical protein OF83DRAFT_1139760 [Amylostereum chailletii]|nr:hypothetical protein OF83DRAFT_1139760 [Amylostereum chailletii]
MGFQYAGPLPPSHPGWLSNSRTFGAPNHTCGLLLYREDLLVPFSRSDLKTEFMPSLPRSYLKCQQSETASSAIMGFQNCASAVDHTHAGWEYSESSLVSPTICRPPQGHHPRPPKLPPKTPKYMACNFHHLTSRDFNEARESEAAKMAAPPLVKGYGDPYGPTVPAIMQPGYRQVCLAIFEGCPAFVQSRVFNGLVGHVSAASTKVLAAISAPSSAGFFPTSILCTRSDAESREKNCTARARILHPFALQSFSPTRISTTLSTLLSPRACPGSSRPLWCSWVRRSSIHGYAWRKTFKRRLQLETDRRFLPPQLSALLSWR